MQESETFLLSSSLRDRHGVFKASQPAQLSVIKTQHTVLWYVEYGGLIPLEACDEVVQAAYDAAMAHGNGGLFDTAQPCGDTPGEYLVAFGMGARWLEIPFVALAFDDALRADRVEFGQGRAFPIAEGKLLQPLIDAVLILCQAYREPHTFHRFAGAFKRAGHEVESRHLICQNPFQGSAIAVGLSPAIVIQGNILLALQATGAVPVGLAVTHDIDQHGDVLPETRLLGIGKRRSILDDGDVRRVDRLHADGVVTGIDMMNFTRHGF